MMDEPSKTSDRIGFIHLRVHKARNLENKDTGGKSDPFIEVQFGNTNAKSSTVMNNQNPEWQFQTKFDVMKDSPKEIVVSILDEDLQSTDPLGQAVLEVQEIISKKQIMKQWIELNKCKTGEIQISSHFVPTENEKFKKRLTDLLCKDTTTKENKQPSLYQKAKIFGKIDLTIHSANSLMNTDLVGSSDPYAVVYYQKRMYKSSTVKNSLNPFWDFSCSLEVDREAPGQAFLRVFDEDIGKDDFLGETYIDLKEVILAGGIKEKNMTLEKCKAGSIMISVSYDTNEKKQVQKGEKAERSETNGFIELNVHKAKAIEKKGKFGIVDPYVSITYGRKNFISPAIKNRHNPEWNYKCKFSVSEISPKSISIEVCDENKTKDRILGNCVIHVRDILAYKNNEEKWIKLENCKSGEILTTMKYIPKDRQDMTRRKMRNTKTES